MERWGELRELSQARMKIQEVVQNGVTGLHEENRELRRRQDKMIADLKESREETREEIQQLREPTDLLRGFATAPAAAPQQSGPPQPGAVQERTCASRLRADARIAVRGSEGRARRPAAARPRHRRPDAGRPAARRRPVRPARHRPPGVGVSGPDTVGRRRPHWLRVVCAEARHRGGKLCLRHSRGPSRGGGWPGHVRPRCATVLCQRTLSVCR